MATNNKPIRARARAAPIAGFIATHLCALWPDSWELYGELADLVA